MKNISKAKLAELRTIVPPLKLQRQFVERLATMRRLQSLQECSLTASNALFAALQYRAFRGEL